MTTFTDCAPDVCKDYRQTGYCGFGDSCKFLHQRTNYKQGWELDREWENFTKGKKGLRGTIVASADRSKHNEDEAEVEEDEEKFPSACFICKESFKSPVVTKCAHYFCEPCALGHYRKSPTCAVCGAETNGVFKSAKELQRLLEKERRQLEK